MCCRLCGRDCESERRAPKQLDEESDGHAPGLDCTVVVDSMGKWNPDDKASGSEMLVRRAVLKLNTIQVPSCNVINPLSSRSSSHTTSL